MGLLLEQHAYGRSTVSELAELEQVLFRFLYVARGGLGAVEQRLNSGVARPLRTLATPAGAMSSADCCATAHELRVLKPVQLALVVAVGNDGHMYMGTAADEGEVLDVLTERLLDAVESVCSPDARTVVNEVHVVPRQERAS